MRLTEMPAPTSMISVIHTLKARAGLADDETYRDFLYREARVRSAKELSAPQAARVIEKMRELAGGGSGNGAVAGLDGPIGSKLRALWISAWNLGIVRDRSDKAMLSYLERQTGVSHIRFLKSSREGNSAIEGLKSWLARAAAVTWPADSEDVIAAKRAVLEAQWRKLLDLGLIKRIGQAVDPLRDLEGYATKLMRQHCWDTMSSANYDEVQQALGRKLRAALERKAAAVQPEDM